MDPVAPAYVDLLTKARVCAANIGMDPSIDFFSSVTGCLNDKTKLLDPAYWAQNLVSPVLFSTAMTSLCQTHPGPKAFLELGPHSALSAPIRQILNHHQAPSASASAPAPADEYIPTLIRNNNSHRDLLTALGELWLRNTPIDLNAIFNTARAKAEFLPDLPLYPWHYTREENAEKLWSETRLAHEWRFRQFPHHELLGVRVLESTEDNPSWRNVLRLESVPWVKDHVVGGQVVFPAAGFVGMLGEAMRQVNGGSLEGGFTVRRLGIRAALVLSTEAEGDEGVEMVTQLIRTDASPGPAGDQTWYNFTIHSYQPKPNGKKGTWIKHVAGRVSSGPGNLPALPPAAPSPSALPRALSRRAWYRKLREMGLEYGPRFMGLNDMSAHPTEKRLVATVVNEIPEAGKQKPGESVYAVHPASLDCLIQAIIPATFNGLTRRFRSLGLPTYIDEIYVCPPLDSSMTIEARIDQHETTGTTTTDISRTITATANNQLAVRISGLQLSTTSITQSSDPFPYGPHAAVELEWREDINLVRDFGSLFRPARIEDAADERRRAEVYALLDRFGAACIFDTARRLDGVEVSPAKPDLVHFKRWVVRAKAMMESGAYPGLRAEDIGALTQAQDVGGTERTQRTTLIEDLYNSLLNPPTPASAPATALYRIHQSALSLLSGEASALDLLSTDNTFHAVNELVQSHADYSAFLSLLAHRKPNLRILEIGGGTGATTRRVLDALRAASTYAERMYYSYTWTDLSPGFVAAAKRTFAGVPGMEFAVLDIERDPLGQGQGQGFEAGSFDLVIACNVSHHPSIHPPRYRSVCRSNQKNRSSTQQPPYTHR
jgi:acyl transferase domain-containing protein